MKKTLFVLIGIMLSWSARAQIEVDTIMSANYLVKKILLGQGVVVGNVKYRGGKYSLGHFSNNDGKFMLKEGILLTSGNVYYAAGPNKSLHSGWASGVAGDADLDNITSGKTQDASVLEFDFVTASENVAFNFIFASEEYPEYVGSKFNDVFGFFVTGPNLNNENIARIPGTDIPISINNVNHETNTEYFVDNSFYNTVDKFVWNAREKKVVYNENYQKPQEEPKFNIEYDGFTKLLQARSKVIPNKIYHIKIAIADVSDGILDSGVFLEAGTFKSFGKRVVKIKNPFKEKPLLTASINNVKPEDLIEKESTKDTLEIHRTINVEFEFDSFVFPDSSERIIQNVFKILKQNPKATVEVYGHTDDFGTDEYNNELSKLRALTVAKYLNKLGIARRRISPKYSGERMPIKSNNHDEGRQKNRRVEFIVKFPES